MSDYSNTYNGAGKDAASSIIFGSDLDTQFDAIAYMSATKADKVLSATADNVAKLDVAGNLVDSGYSFPNLVGAATPTAAELNLLSGKTGTIWTSDNDGPSSGLDADTLDGIDSDVLLRRISGITALQALTGQVAGERVYLTYRSTEGDGAHGVFRWDGSDLSANVAIDEVTTGSGDGGIYVAPSSDKTGTSGAWVREHDGDVYTEWYGAVGDGITDDLSAILAAENYAYNNGLSLYGRPDRNYAFNGRLGVRVSIYGNGCSFTPLSTSSSYDTISNYHSSGTKATDIEFRDFSVYPSSRTCGMYMTGAHRCTIENVKVYNCASAGISTYLSNDVTVNECYVSGVVYETGGTSADGIYFGGCKRGVAIDNMVTDFRRIGIVSESDGTVKSYDTHVIGNKVWYAHDCDDSTTEYNAAIWFENTNGGVIAHNEAWDIAGNPGQTSGRVNGIVVVGLGTDSDSMVKCHHNSLDGANFELSGSGGYAAIEMLGNETRDSESVGLSKGITVGSGLQTLTIRDHHFSGMTLGNAGTDALILADFSTTVDAVALTLDNLTYNNITDAGLSDDWAHINVFSGAPTRLNIVNCNQNGLGIIMRNVAAKNIFISNSSVLIGAATYSSLAGETVLIQNSTFERFGTRPNTGLFSQSYTSDVTIKIENSIFNNIVYSMEGSVYLDMTFSGCSFVNGSQMQLNAQAGCTVKFEGGIAKEYPSTGFIYTNFYTSTPADRLFVRGMDFVSSVAATPIQKWNYDPDVVVITGCTTNAGAITNLAVTYVADNVTSITV